MTKVLSKRVLIVDDTPRVIVKISTGEVLIDSLDFNRDDRYLKRDEESVYVGNTWFQWLKENSLNVKIMSHRDVNTFGIRYIVVAELFEDKCSHFLLNWNI